jgi:hypothetical protein
MSCISLTSVTFEGSGVIMGDNAFANYSDPYSPINTLRDAYTIGGAGTYKRTAGQEDWITAEAAAYLDQFMEQLTALPGTSVDNPVTIAFAATNISGIWGRISTSISDAKTYVILDLSDCTVDGNAIGGDPNNSSSGNSMNSIQYNGFIKGIILPSTLETIGGFAFYNCTSLTSVTIPENVISIGYMAFRNCPNLTAISIPDTVTSIDGYAFYGCTGLSSVIIGDSVISIGTNAFYNCRSLTTITIPDSVTSIGSDAFSGCYNFVSVTFEKSGIDISASGFSGNLSDEYTISGAGTYIRAIGASAIWTKN